MESPGYRKLVVWQRSHAFLRAVLDAVKDFPRSEEARILKTQLLRASMSVPANVVEGYGSQRGRNFTRHLKLSRGSAWEAEYWLLLGFELRFLDEPVYRKVHGLCHEVIAILTSAIRKQES